MCVGGRCNKARQVPVALICLNIVQEEESFFTSQTPKKPDFSSGRSNLVNLKEWREGQEAFTRLWRKNEV